MTMSIPQPKHVSDGETGVMGGKEFILSHSVVNVDAGLYAPPFFPYNILHIVFPICSIINIFPGNPR